MPLPINLNDILSGRTVEWKSISDFKDLNDAEKWLKIRLNMISPPEPVPTPRVETHDHALRVSVLKTSRLDFVRNFLFLLGDHV